MSRRTITFLFLGLVRAVFACSCRSLAQSAARLPAAASTHAPERACEVSSLSAIPSDSAIFCRTNDFLQPFDHSALPTTVTGWRCRPGHTASENRRVGRRRSRSTRHHKMSNNHNPRVGIFLKIIVIITITTIFQSKASSVFRINWQKANIVVFNFSNRQEVSQKIQK